MAEAKLEEAEEQGDEEQAEEARKIIEAISRFEAQGYFQPPRTLTASC
jgi:hypothetical protein